MIAKVARSQDIGIRADPLPEGFAAKASKQNRDGVEWVAMSVTHPLAKSVRAQIAVERRAMPTHAMRVKAAKSYINTIGSAMGKGGFSPLSIKMPDLERADYTKIIMMEIEFANKAEQKLLCAIQIWFTASAGYCGAVISSEHEDRDPLLKWLSSVKTKGEARPLREWTSLSGKTLEAALISADLRKVKLERKDGSQIEVAISQLSKADQDAVNNSPLQSTIYSDPKHSARTLLPSGFATARPIRPEAQSFRHIEGHGLHFIVVPWPETEVSIEKLFAKTSQQPLESVSRLADAKLDILTTQSTKPVHGTIAKYYGTRLGENFLLVVGESQVARMPEYKEVFDDVMQTLQTR